MKSIHEMNCNQVVQKRSGTAPLLHYSPHPPTASSVIHTYVHITQHLTPDKDLYRHRMVGWQEQVTEHWLSETTSTEYVCHVYCMHAENPLLHCCDKVELIIIRLVGAYMRKSTYFVIQLDCRKL